MALKAIISEDELGELTQEQQALYAWDEDSQAYRLEAEGLDQHPAVAGRLQKLEAAHKRSQKERNEQKQKAQDLERRLGKLLQVDEEIDLEDVDEERLQQVVPYLMGEGELPKGNDGKQVDIESIKQQARKPLQKELDQLKQQRDQAQQQVEQMVRDQALNEALQAAKIDTPFMGPLKAYFGQSIKVETDDNGNVQPVIETELGPQDPKSYIKEWAASEEGRVYVQGNQGSGAKGTNGSGGSGPNPWQSDQWNTTEQARIAREDPEKAKRLARAAGKPEPRV